MKYINMEYEIYYILLYYRSIQLEISVKVCTYLTVPRVNNNCLIYQWR